MTTEKFLRIEEVSEKTGIPVGTLRWWRKISARKNAKQFGPTSAKFGGRIVYRESDVDAWIASQFARTAR